MLGGNSMIVYEFYLKDAVKGQAFDVLCNTFYKLGNVGKPRKVDGVDGSAVYAISRNPNTNWVQLLVDDNTPEGILTAIEAKINGLCDTTFAKYSSPHDNLAPIERKRAEIGV
jgi:hypothetical protein